MIVMSFMISKGSEDGKSCIRLGGETGDLFEKVLDFSDIAEAHDVIGDRRVEAKTTVVKYSQFVPSVRLMRLVANYRGGVPVVEVELAN
jgi:hypothetical protein